MIRPIDPLQQQQVLQATDSCLQRAGRLFGLQNAAVPVSFDLRGRAAGQYRVARGKPGIRYNPYIFARYFPDSLAETVPHEVAHHVVDRLYGLRNVRPHGAEWQQVMRLLGAVPRATARYDLSGIPVRRQRRFDYRCDCCAHSITTSRHNRIRRGDAVYLCRCCHAPIVFAGTAAAP
jgi:SprT protein